MGTYFEEHHYQRQNETFIGDWKFYGHDTAIGSNYGGDVLGCSSCSSDKKRRHQNKIGKPLRSYQVDGSTQTEDFYWWEYGVCENKLCWGPYDRTIKFQRRNNLMRVSHFKKIKSSNNPPERLDQVFFKISKQSQENIYSGLACPVSLGGFFWPLFKDIVEKQQLHIYIRMISKKLLPEAVKLSEKKDYPPFYKNNPHYIYPQTLEMRIFGEGNGPLPSTIEELEDSGRPELGKVFWFSLPRRCRSSAGSLQIPGRTKT